MKQVTTTTALNNPMAKAVKSLVKAVTLSASTADLITASTKQTIKTATTKKLTLDGFQADGVKSFMLNKPAKGKDNPNAELHSQVNLAIVNGLDPEVQTLLKKETKTLSDMEKGVKRYWQQQIGSEFAYYRRQLKDREEKLIAGDTEKSTPVEMYFKDLQSALDRLAKLEDLDFDLVQHSTALKKLLADK
jgi:hypothetical protein